MAVRTIVRFPDPRLKVVAEPVTDFDEDLRAFAGDLLDTMRAAPGIGITGPHIGVARRVVVLQLATVEPVRTYVNPELTWMSDEKIRHVEGSVSMPGVTEQIERAARVRVNFVTLGGVASDEDAEGLLAVCLQHEIDQLNGIFWIDRLSRLKRDRTVKRFQKLLKRQ